MEANPQEIVALLQALMRIPTINSGVMPTRTRDLCRYLQDFLAPERIASDILESAPRRGNLLATLTGEPAGDSLMSMAQTDVMPIEG